MKQIDVEAIIKRLIFLEHSISFLLDDFQLEGLQLRRPVTAEEIRKLRKKCNFIEDLNSDDSDSEPTVGGDKEKGSQENSDKKG